MFCGWGWNIGQTFFPQTSGGNCGGGGAVVQLPNVSFSKVAITYPVNICWKGCGNALFCCCADSLTLKSTYCCAYSRRWSDSNRINCGVVKVDNFTIMENSALFYDREISEIKVAQNVILYWSMIWWTRKSEKKLSDKSETCYSCKIWQFYLVLLPPSLPYQCRKLCGH